ncbi:hypothetical protein RB595_002195 [Gaeumannomyces hyphopodioides]
MAVQTAPDSRVEFSSTREARAILERILSMVSLPPEVEDIARAASFVSTRDLPYFPIPLKETELGAALKAIEGSFARALADKRDHPPAALEDGDSSKVTVNLERTTAFLFQTYLSSIGGLSKLDPNVKELLKDTDLLRAQSDPYRRMSANLYATARSGEYYHIHGSLEASTTLSMLDLKPFRPDLSALGHEAIVEEIESHVKRFTPAELEELNAENRQAGVPALRHEDFLKTAHGMANMKLPPWSVDQLESQTPPCPLPATSSSSSSSNSTRARPLAGIKVLELSRIIAGPIIGRALAEYGADVLKITAPALSDVPFFQVDSNMGKRTAELDLKSEAGRNRFEALLAEADVVVDGYRPGAIERLGYGAKKLSALAQKRGRGFVYVSENCFGHEGEWRHRPGWQQIADCVSGVAWEQGRFMGLDEPVVPPFPISDYGTGCMGAIAALTGLYRRATEGGSWHGRVSLLHHDLLLFKMGRYPEGVQKMLLQRSPASPNGTNGHRGTNGTTNGHRVDARDGFLAMRHSNSVDQVSKAALAWMRHKYPSFFETELPGMTERWRSAAYGAEVSVVQPVVWLDGIEFGFSRASRPNGSDEATWDGFGGPGDDVRLS